MSRYSIGILLCAFLVLTPAAINAQPPAPSATNWIGLLLKDYSDEVLGKLRAQAPGPVVVGTVPGGPSDNARLQIGDVIRSINSTPTPNIDAFKQAFLTHMPGDDLQITFDRLGQPRRTSITVTTENEHLNTTLRSGAYPSPSKADEPNQFTTCGLPDPLYYSEYTSEERNSLAAFILDRRPSFRSLLQAPLVRQFLATTTYPEATINAIVIDYCHRLFNMPGVSDAQRGSDVSALLGTFIELVTIHAPELGKRKS